MPLTLGDNTLAQTRWQRSSRRRRRQKRSVFRSLSCWAVSTMPPNEKVGPQSIIPRGTDTDKATTATSESNGNGHRTASTEPPKDLDNDGWGDLALAPQHVQKLQSSGIDPLTASYREYETIRDHRRLDELGFTKALCDYHYVPGLLIPLHDHLGSVWGYHYRPDTPRRHENGKEIKYESQSRQRGASSGLDFPPLCAQMLGDPKEPKWITEGAIKADALAQLGCAAIGLRGVTGWQGSNSKSGKTALEDWRHVASNSELYVIAYDSDVARKKPVQHQMVDLGNYLYHRSRVKAQVRYLHLPDGPDGQKWGVDDYLAAGHTKDELWRLVKPDMPSLVDAEEEEEEESQPEPWQPVQLTELHERCLHWFGDHYDLDAIDAALAAAAVEKLTTMIRCGC